MRRLSVKYIPYFPIVGMTIYVMLFIVASQDYPGGSANIPNATGYSFFHNFLCDLMHPFTPTGAVNGARTVAIISHVILSLTMLCFFYILPKIFEVKNRNTRLITTFGVLTMVLFVFMYSPYHDLIVITTGVFGSIALVPFFIEMHRYANKGLKKLAYLCYAMSFIVFFIFVSKWGIYYLPIIQKLTFVLDAWWVIWTSLVVINKNKLVLQQT